MGDPRDDPGEGVQVAPALDSHGSSRKPSRKAALPDVAKLGASKEQKPLDECAAVPLHLKLVATYAEVASLGIAPERTLRRLVAVGRVKRAVLRAGRSVRFVVRDLIDELRGAED